MKFWKLVSVATALTLSSNANAVIINSLNSIEYQWLEVTQTLSMSRDQVEAQLNDSNSALYGYEYASRALFEDLLHSYASWDGLNGWHGDALVTYGMHQFVNDFGVTNSNPGDGIPHPFTTVDGYSVTIDGYLQTRGMYGAANECTITNYSCYSSQVVQLDVNLNASMAKQAHDMGWDSNSIGYVHNNTLELQNVGSFLVMNVSAVPVPAAVWLFGSGLIGLAGVARRKKA